MKIIVNPHKLEIEKSPVNEKEINITKCEFVFNDIEQDLVKKAFFTLKDTTYEQIIVNGECDIPSEVLEEQGQIEIGVIAYQVENEEYIKRYNPSPAYFTTWKGSLKEAENSSKPTPSQIEQIESEIATIQNDIIDLDNNKQDTLVSGENIKTINNQGLLGSGNIDLNETYYTKGEVDSIKTTIEGEIPTKVSQLDNDSEYITKEVNNLTYYTLATNTGSTIELGINTSTYVMTLNLKNEAGTTISTQSIDLPLETMVVDANYDSTTKEIVLVLKNGTEVRFSVADLVSGLQSEITPSNKLSSDLVDDTGHTNKFVTSSDITNWNNKIDSSALTDYVKNTDYASSSVGGVIKVSTFRGLQVSSGNLQSVVKTYEQYTNSTQTSDNAFIGKGTLENVITGKELTNKTYVDEENATQDTQIEALQEENNYLNSIIDQLPKVSGEGTNITLNNTIEGKMSLELGSSELEQGADPSPSNPQQIHTISGDNEIVVCNKNLFNNDTCVLGKVWNGVSNNKRAYGHIEATQGQSYTISNNNTNNDLTIYVVETTEIGQAINPIKQTQLTNSNYTFTPQSTTRYIVIQFSTTANNTTQEDIDNAYIMIEQGSTATSYVEHKEQVKEINLGNLEYCEIGDYKDEFYLATSSDTGLVSGKWYLKKNIGKVVLDGSEDWAIEQTGTENWYYSLRYTDIFPANNYLLSNYYLRAQGISSANTTQGLSHIVGSTQWFIRIRYGTEDTVNNYKTWLSTHNLIDYYPLATPTYTLLNDTLQDQINDIYYTMKSYKEQTSISQVNNDLEFTIKASALLDLNTLIG